MQPIGLMSVHVDQIVVSDKFKHSDTGFKYFIPYQEGEIVMYYFTSDEWIHQILRKQWKKHVFFD